MLSKTTTTLAFAAADQPRTGRRVGSAQRHRQPALRSAAADQYGFPSGAHAPRVRAHQRSAAAVAVPGELPAVRADDDRLVDPPAAASASLGGRLLSRLREPRGEAVFGRPLFFGYLASTKRSIPSAQPSSSLV